jgi:hypothetical protein
MTYGEMAIGVRLEFLRPGDQIETPSGYLQLALTSDGAKLLVQDILKAIAVIDRPSIAPRN